MTKEIISFIGPGLYRRERLFIKKMTLSSVLLFGLGCSFSYFVVIPLVLEFLYKYGEIIGIATFLDISQFVPFCTSVSACIRYFLSTPITNVGHHDFWICSAKVLEK